MSYTWRLKCKLMRILQCPHLIFALVFISPNTEVIFLCRMSYVPLSYAFKTFYCCPRIRQAVTMSQYLPAWLALTNCAIQFPLSQETQQSYTHSSRNRISRDYFLPRFYQKGHNKKVRMQVCYQSWLTHHMRSVKCNLFKTGDSYWSAASLVWQRRQTEGSGWTKHHFAMIRNKDHTM